jgi:hypothetical protein
MKTFIFLLFLCPAVVIAQPRVPTSASSTDVSQGTRDDVYISPLDLANYNSNGVYTSYSTNGLEIIATNNIYVDRGYLGGKFGGTTAYVPSITTISPNVGTGGWVEMYSNSVNTSVAFTIRIVSGSSGFTVNTNIALIAFGQTFSNKPIVFLSLAQPTNSSSITAGMTQFRADADQMTTSNFWLVSGGSAMSANNTNHLNVLVIGR